MSGLTLERAAIERGARLTGSMPKNRPLRVCYMIDELANAGTETQLLALMRRVDRRKVLPYLCLLRGEDPSSRALEPDDVPVLRLGVRSLLSPRGMTQALRLARFLRRERIDAVQVYFPDSTYFGMPVAWLAGVPHRLRTRNNSGHWTTMLHRLLGCCLNRITTGTLTNCHAARDSLLRDEAPNPALVHVLENGVDLERFDRIPAYSGGNQRMRIGVVANLRHVKGLDVLIEAAVGLTEKHAALTIEIIGEGMERAALQQQIDAAGISQRVMLRGGCDNVPGFLAQLDVAVLCSRAEGMPNAVLEYMAAGRPIVATRVGAVAELIEDGIHGLLVPPNDASALARAISRLVTDRCLARSCAAAARERVAEHYGRAAMMRRFEEFYDRLSRR